MYPLYLLIKVGMKDCKPAPTPLPSIEKLSAQLGQRVVQDLLFPGGITSFTGRLVPGFLLRHLLHEHHLPGFLSLRQRLPQTKIVLAPKPLQSWGVRQPRPAARRGPPRGRVGRSAAPWQRFKREIERAREGRM